MRIPFDLIAAVLALEAVLRTFKVELTARFPDICTYANELDYAFQTSSGWQALAAMLGYWLVVWLMHEFLARRAEWRTRFGHQPQGFPANLKEHPLEIHARGVAYAQGASVCLYVLFLYYFRWALKAEAWPLWIGLGGLSPDWLNRLSSSQLVGNILLLGPFVVAMAIGWIPKIRLGGRRSGRTSFWEYMTFEARLTLLPFAVLMFMGLIFDVAYLVLPSQAVDMLNSAMGDGPTTSQDPWGTTWEILIGLAGTLVMLAVVMPLSIIRFWQCDPMPEGPLKERLSALWKASGVKARAILSWGPKESGLANACVLGPWSKFRFILISPGLARELTLEECDAVLAHELGHAKYGHLMLLVVVIFGMASMTGIAMRATPTWPPLAQAALMFILMSLYIRVFYGALSRACEKEADLASAEMTGTPEPLITALDKIGHMAGGIREVYTWHHGSIAERIDHLRAIAVNADAARTFHKRMTRIRVGFVLFAGLSVLAHILW